MGVYVMSQVNDSAKNIRWINYMRAICIIAIYYIHAQEFFEYAVPGLAKYILPFYVNAFFFASGYLFFRKQIQAVEQGTLRAERKRFLTNLLFRMVISSIVFAFIEYIPGSIIQHRGFSFISFIEKTIWGNTFWFISALLVAELLLYLLIHTKITNMWFYLISAVMLFMIGWLIADKGLLLIGNFESNPWQFEKGLMAVLFLVIGGIYWKYEEQIDRILKKTYVFFAILTVYILVLTLFSNHIHVLISINSINLAGVSVSVLSICVLLVLCKAIKSTNIITEQLNKIGKHTIGFYFVCGAIPKVLMIVLPKILPKGNVLYMLFGFVLSFLLAYIIVFFMERFLPFLFDLRRGISFKKQTGKA